MNSQLDLGFLKTLTENPEFLQKAMNIASTLSSSGMLQNLMGQSPTPAQGAVSPNSPAHGNEGSAMLGDIMKLLSNGSQGQSAQNTPSAPNPQASPLQKPQKPHSSACHSDRIRLLEAMRPFVPEERREKLDFIIRLMGLIKLADNLGLSHILGGNAL